MERILADGGVSERTELSKVAERTKIPGYSLGLLDVMRKTLEAFGGKYIRIQRLNTLENIRPLAAWQPVTVDFNSFVAEPYYRSGLWAVHRGSDVKLKWEYANATKVTLPVDIKETMADKTIIDSFRMGSGKIIREVTYKVDKPISIDSSAEISVRGRRPNKLTQTFPVGILDYRLKPIEEYPVLGAENITGPWTDDWLDWMSRADRFSVDYMLMVSFLSSWSFTQRGFSREGNIWYKNHDETQSVTIELVFKNPFPPPASLAVESLGGSPPVLYTTYEDRTRFSLVGVGKPLSAVEIPGGETAIHRFTASIPDWSYGEVVMWMPYALRAGSTKYPVMEISYPFRIGRIIAS